jgi:hypothetical protein
MNEHALRHHPCLLVHHQVPKALRMLQLAHRIVSFLNMDICSLITGHWLLVTGYWSLVTGHWLLVTGYWSLVTDY